MAPILPNAILVGAQKGGTTALYNWLSQHPDIFGEPAMKDFPFFCTEGYRESGIEWFARQFSRHQGEKIVLHGYVNYLTLSQESAPLISRDLEDAKIFVVLRNPVERAYSAYLQAIKMGRDDAKTFEVALERENTKKPVSFAQRMDRGYLQHGFYSPNLTTFRKYFSPDNIQILLFDDLKNEPYRVCEDLFKFFGVDSSFRPELRQMNTYAEPRSRTIRKLINFGIPVKAIRDLIPMNQRINIRRRLHNLNFRSTAKPEIKPETASYLQRVYGDEINRLEDLLGRELSAWRNATF